MKISSVKADATLASTGVEFEFGEPVDDQQAFLRIAYSGNEAYRNKLARITRNAAQQLTGREIPPETMAKLQRKAMAGTVLTGWRNLEHDDGKAIEVNDDEAFKLLEISAVYDFVSAKSNELERFQKEKGDAAKGAMKSGAVVEPKVVKTP